MTAKSMRFLIALTALAILLAGCSWGRKTTVAPRQEPNQSRLAADLEAVRQENEEMRRRQQENEVKLAELQRKLIQTQEEERRFRATMTTNFDLMEQSVALTLSKRMNDDLSKAPSTRRESASPAPVAAPAEQQNPPAKVDANRARPAVVSATRPATARSSARSDGSRQAATSNAAARSGSPAEKSPPQGGAVTMAAMNGAAMNGAARTVSRAENQPPAENQDLVPPASPAKLKAHREAKPLYERGFALFVRKEYVQSIIVFQNFLNRFPADIYSDNAQFWIGESYRNMKRHQEAEAAYRNVLQNYEHRSTLEGYKTPDAIYRLGQGYQARNEPRQARHYFQTLVERFPGTSAGRKAQRELDTIGMNTAAN